MGLFVLVVPDPFIGMRQLVQLRGPGSFEVNQQQQQCEYGLSRKLKTKCNLTRIKFPLNAFLCVGWQPPAPMCDVFLIPRKRSKPALTNKGPTQVSTRAIRI